MTASAPRLEDELTCRRQRCMRVLAAAATAEIEAALATVPQPELAEVRPPGTGLVMVRGRMGGTGRRFNLGEVTVTRCAVSDGRVVGHGYVRGRDRHKALLVARCDAMLQLESHAAAVELLVVAPLAEAEAERAAAAARRAAATRVEFFTLVRGED